MNVKIIFRPGLISQFSVLLLLCMDFKELVHQAERNAKRQERKVHEAEREMKARQQQHMERLAYEKAREKLALKRRAATAQQQQQQSQKASTAHATGSKRGRTSSDAVTPGHRPDTQSNGDEPKFVIPKKSGVVAAVTVPSSCASVDKLNGFSKQNAKQLGQVQQRQSKASFSSPSTDGKKPRISNPPTMVPQPKHDPFKELMAQATQNDASAVERLIEQADAVANAKEQKLKQQQIQRKHNSRTAVPTTAKAPEAAEMGVSAGRELTYAAAVRERLARQQQEAVLDKQRRLTATGYRLLPSEGSETTKLTAASTKFGHQQQQKTKSPGVLNDGQTMASKIAKIAHNQQQQEQRATPAVQQMSRQTNGIGSSSLPVPKRNIEMHSRGNKNVNNSKMTTTPPTKTAATIAKKSVQQPQQQNVQPQSQLAGTDQLPQKRYLPGDTRYRGPTAATSQANNNNKKAVQTMVADKKRLTVSNGIALMTNNGPSESSTTKLATGAPKKMAEKAIKESNKMTSVVGGGVGKTPHKIGGVNAELDRSRAREMELEAQLMAEREKVARMAAMVNKKQQAEEEGAVAEANRKRKQQLQAGARRISNTTTTTNRTNNNNCVNSTGSLARIKREAQLRREMAMAAHRRDRPSSSSRKYANYSETDDDEEDDDRYGAGMDDDEYDSDLADFIDDSMVDDLQREDFEETLKIINPRYNKEKWLAREQMIDERRMDARFRDVEAEERHSSRLGLVEDLREAKRGSKALG